MARKTLTRQDWLMRIETMEKARDMVEAELISDRLNRMAANAAEGAAAAQAVHNTLVRLSEQMDRLIDIANAKRSKTLQ